LLPFPFIQKFKALFVGLTRIFRGLRGSDAKRVSLHVCEPAETNCTDVRIVQRPTETKHDRIRLKSGKIGADFASCELALVHTTLWAYSPRIGAGRQRIDSTNRRVIKHSRIPCAELEAEIALRIRVSLRTDDTFADAFDNDAIGRSCPVGESHITGK